MKKGVLKNFEKFTGKYLILLTQFIYLKIEKKHF